MAETRKQATAPTKKPSKENAMKLKKVITPEFRVSFPSVFKAKSFEGQAEKYSITGLFKKTTDLSAIKKAAFNCAAEKWGADKTKWPKGLRMPWRDGDEKADLQGYAGHIFITATSKQKPAVVGPRKMDDGAFERLESESQFYAGCFARASFVAFAYDTKGNRGISFSLQNVQKTRDGEAFSGRKAAEEEFDEIEDSSDNAANFEDTDSDDGDSDDDDDETSDLFS